MKKLALLMMALSAFAFGAYARNVSVETEFATSTTNATSVYADCQAYTGDFATYDTVCVMSPPANTGSVAIAVLRMGVYQTVATVLCSNTTDAAVSSVDMADIPVNGLIRFTFQQERASTNRWGAISFFGGINR